MKRCILQGPIKNSAMLLLRSFYLMGLRQGGACQLLQKINRPEQKKYMEYYGVV